MSVPFDQLFETADLKGETSIRITESAKDLSGSDLQITNNHILYFENSHEFTCKSITVTDCTVEIHDLSMNGSITVKNNGRLKLVNCFIHSPGEGCDYIVAALEKSIVNISGCAFFDTSHFGLCADNRSVIEIEASTVKKCKLFSVVLSGFSILHAYDCIFSKSEADIIYAESDCTILMWRCSIKKTTRLGISAGSRCSINMNYCHIDHCESGAMSTSGCDRVFIENCTIEEIPHTAILFEQTTALVKNSRIDSCNGNAINASRGSQVILNHSSFYNTTYPPVALCEHSIGFLKDCSIVNSEMSGIIIRSGSKASIDRCFIQQVKQCGIVVSDSHEVSLKECFVIDCGESCIMVYNHSNCLVRRCILIGPAKTGINVFTGGFVDSSESVICGMREQCAWIHHGGSARLTATKIQTEPYEDFIKDGSKIIEALKLIDDDDEEENERETNETEEEDEEEEEEEETQNEQQQSTTDENEQQNHDKMTHKHQKHQKKHKKSRLHEKQKHDDKSKNKNKFKGIVAETMNKVEMRQQFQQQKNKMCHDIDLDKLFKIESERIFVSTDSIASGRRIPNMILNIESDEPVAGINATHPTCKACGCDASGCHFSTCGHCLYCRACWANLEKKPEYCELCFMPVEKIVAPIDCSHEDDENVCGICLDKNVDTIIVPCGHTICYECAEHWFTDNSECPFCREPFSKHRRYVSYS